MKTTKSLSQFKSGAILLAAACLLQAGKARARIVLVRGTMRTEVVTTDRRIIHLPQGVRRFRLLVPVYPSFTIGPNQQQVISAETHFSLEPAFTQELVDTYGNHYTEAIWNSPPAGDVVEETVARAMLSLNAAPGAHPAPYPLARESLPSDVLRYLQPTAQVQSDDPAIRRAVEEIQQRKDLHSESAVVDATVSWVVDHLQYLPDGGQYDARTTLLSGRGECTGYSHLAMAMLRAMGIPARLAVGIKFKQPYSIQGQGRFFAVEGEARRGYLYHAWIQVYFPGQGWVAYDPQGDFGLVDTRCVTFAVGPDKESLPEGRFISTEMAIPQGGAFSEDSDAQVSVTSDDVHLTAQAVVDRGPTKDGLYLARAGG